MLSIKIVSSYATENTTVQAFIFMTVLVSGLMTFLMKYKSVILAMLSFCQKLSKATERTAQLKVSTINSLTTFRKHQHENKEPYLQ